MSKKIYGAMQLTGGTNDSLDGINGNDLSEGDAAIVIEEHSDNRRVLVYTLHVFGSAQSESSPDKIVPDTNPGNKAWVLEKLAVGDNDEIQLGTGTDASLKWDGTDLIIEYDKQNSGSSSVKVQQNGSDVFAGDSSGVFDVTDRINMSTSGPLLIGKDHGLSVGDESTVYGKGARALEDDGGTVANNHPRSTVVGYEAGNNTGSGVFGLSAFGYQAARDNTGDHATAHGYQAAQVNSGNKVTAAGYRAARSNTGHRITAHGYQAGQNNTGNDCVLIGREAGSNNSTANQFFLQQGNINSEALIQGDFSTGVANLLVQGLVARSSDPTDPSTNQSVMWQTDGSSGSAGDDGDIIMKVTDSSGTTKTVTLIDFSAN